MSLYKSIYGKGQRNAPCAVSGAWRGGNGAGARENARGYGLGFNRAESL